MIGGRFKRTCGGKMIEFPSLHRGLWRLLVWLLALELTSERRYSLQETVLAAGLPQLLADADPDFRGPHGNVTVAVGKEAVLTCSVTELGHYKVGWMRAEDQTILSLHSKVVTHNSRVSVTHDNNHTWRLHIRQVKEADRGCYMCQINTSVMKKQVVCLDVHVPPDIVDEQTSSDVTVKEGENATLVCRATGHPHPRITWKRENGAPMIIKKNSRSFSKVETFNGEVLSLVKLDRKQMGAYMCIASNDVPPAVSKRIVLNIHFPPKVTVPNQLLGAPLETDVHIDCYVEAFPNTINYWVKNRGEMLLDGNKHTIEKSQEGYKIHLELTIKSFSKEDVGTYMCVSRNSLGHADGTVRLYDIKIATKGPDATTNTAVISDTGFFATSPNITKGFAKQISQRKKATKPLVEESALGRSSASEDAAPEGASERSEASTPSACKLSSSANIIAVVVLVHVVR